jgi:ABC-type polysaccharide/polyol phosphate export permease
MVMKKKIGKTLRRFDFAGNLLRYRRYILLSVKASLKKEVAGSYLSWIWLILEPIFLTILYGVVISLFMRGNGLSFGVFILCGIMAMTFFQGGVMKSMGLIGSKKLLIREIRIPKYILICEVIGKNLSTFAISFVLVIILMVIAKVRFTPYLIFLPVILALLILLTFAFSLFSMHIGAYVPDARKTMKMVFRLLFYVSGTIFPIDKVIDPERHEQLVNFLMYGNPIAFIMQQFRLVTVYGKPPDYLFIGIWLAAGLLLSFLGLKLIEKHERNYSKID